MSEHGTTRWPLNDDIADLEELSPAAVRCYERIRAKLPPSNPADPDDAGVSLATLMAILHSLAWRLDRARTVLR
jgi:hypothetical protein